MYTTFERFCEIWSFTYDSLFKINRSTAGADVSVEGLKLYDMKLFRSVDLDSLV